MTGARKLAIIGAGGLGRGVVDVIRAINARSSAGARWDLLGVYDDSLSAVNAERLQVLGVRYLGPLDSAMSIPPQHYAIGINSPVVKERLSSKLDAAGWTAALLIHPDATVETLREIGEGSVIRAGVRIATNTSVGRHVHLNFNVVLGHDVVLNDFVSVNPLASVAGEVEVGRRCVIGTNATVLQGRSIGPDTIVGAAACVTHSHAGGATLVGVPARQT